MVPAAGGRTRAVLQRDASCLRGCPPPLICYNFKEHTTDTMTATELNAAIAAGKFKVTRLPVRGPRKGEATMAQVGGAKTAWRPSVRAGHANRHIRSGAPA